VTAPENPSEPLGWDGIAAVFILLVACVSLHNWLPDSSGAVLALRGLWIFLYLATVTVLTLRYGNQYVTWMIRQQPALCILLLATLASFLWSVDPLVSLRTAVSLVGTTALGVFIGYHQPARIMQILGWTFAILLVSSAMAVGLLPAPVSRTVGWRGIMGHKNSFGAAAALAAIFFVVMAQRRAIQPRWLATGICVLAVAALTQARSRTALAGFAASLMMLAYLWMATSSGHPTLPALRRLSLLLVLCVSILPFFIGPIGSAIGNDDPLNGRTRLWSGVMTIASERPLTGYGYEAVWRPKQGTLLPHIPTTAHASATTAHNSILNVACEIGIPAAVVACFYLFAALVDAARLLEKAPSAFSLFALLFCFSIVVMGFAEAHLLRVHSVVWILFVALTVAVKRSLESLDHAASPAGAQA
jgi:O-antigen ligase